MATADPAPATPVKARKLSFKEQRELESLPGTNETLETEIAALHADMAQPQFYQQPGETIAKVQKQLFEREARLVHAYRRWTELE